MAAISAQVGCDVSAGDPAPSERRSDRPNVLIIVTDDQRSEGTLAVMPRTRRWFVRDGTNFKRAYVTTPLCCPARASVFTGRYAHNHRVRGNLASFRLDQLTTLQHALQEAGYFTAIAGKYLNGWPVEKDPPHFDRWAVVPRGYRDVDMNLDGSVRRMDGYSTDIVARMAVEFLRSSESSDDRPWYLYVAPTAPHPPFEPAASYARASVPPRRRDPATRETDVSDKPPYLWVREVGKGVPQHLTGRGRIAAKAATIRRLQLRTLMSVDDLVGRLMAALGRMDERRDTLALFLSDNGYLWGEHRSISKRLPYTPSVQVPLMMRYPGHAPAGADSDRPSLNVDIAPTVAQAAGLPQSFAARMDGVSLLEPVRRPHLFFEHWGSARRGRVPTWFSLRTGAYQLVRYVAGSGSELEYYDLRRDPWQLRNLLGDEDPANDPPRARVRRLLDLIESYRRCRGRSCP